MAIQTRQFPILFGLAGTLFSGLFIAFYLLVFDSIQEIFTVQDQAILDKLATGAAQRHQQLYREAKILHRSRGVQRLFATTKEEMPDETVVRSLQQRLLDWRDQFPAGAYRSASYLSLQLEPISVVDFSLHGRFGNQESSENTDMYNNTPTEEETILSNPTIIQSWSLTPPILSGAYVLQLSDSTQVLRTVLPILDRKTKEPNGYLAIDHKTPDSWALDKSKQLLVIDRNHGHIVYFSSDPQAAGQPLERLQEHFHEALLPTVENSLGSVVLMYDDTELLLSRQLERDSGIEVAMTTLLDPYTAGPRMRGRLLIVASLLFVLIAGISIYVLTARVRRNAEVLEATNGKLEQANKLVSDHNRLLEEELQTAHDMQMSLMPQKNPQVSGFDIEGGCIPATAVGGDFYQYFLITEERLVIVMADVTGHGMQAAIPTMVFSGLLDTQVNYSPTVEDLMPQLNRSLHRVLEPRTFVCLSLGELNPLSGRLRLSNGGCPYPFIYRTSTKEVEEVNLSALPLGVRAESTYEVKEVNLDPGDIVVMCSDGIIEAANKDGELYGFDRVTKAIHYAGRLKMNAQELIRHLFDEVEKFTQYSERDDDQTVVVLIRTEK